MAEETTTTEEETSEVETTATETEQRETANTETEPEKDSEAVLRAENQRLKREAAEREKDRRKAEREAKQHEDARKAEQGQWKELAEERAREVEQLKAQITERDKRDAEREQRTTVEKAAERLHFRRPRRAFALLIDELGAEEAANTLTDEQLTEAALRRLARAEPELVDNQRRSGAPVNGGGPGGGKSKPEEALNSTIASLLAGRTPE